jgi:nucleotide-binding universal stress UspA family protein
MKKILVPTDFSPASLQACKFAIDLAHAISAEVLLVHMVEIPVIHETTFGVQPYLYAMEQVREAEETAAEEYERFRKEIASSVPVSFRAIHDEIITGIPKAVKDYGVDLIIMSTHGASGLEEFIVGSKAEKIARYSPVPVIAIPKDALYQKIRNIVFANNLEPNQDHLVGKVKQLQKLFDATLHILLVNTPHLFHGDAESRQLLHAFAADHAFSNFTLNVRDDQHERDGIVMFSKEIKADLIAMGTHGRRGLAHFIKGSIAEDVLNHVDCPVWTCRLIP